MVAPKKRRSKRIVPSSVYLGHLQLRKDREAELDRIARDLGLEGRSQLIQQIADGLLVVRRL